MGMRSEMMITGKGARLPFSKLLGETFDVVIVVIMSFIPSALCLAFIVLDLVEELCMCLLAGLELLIVDCRVPV